MPRYNDIGRVPGAWRDSTIATAASSALMHHGYYDPDVDGPNARVGGSSGWGSGVSVYVTAENRSRFEQLNAQASVIRGRLSAGETGPAIRNTIDRYNAAVRDLSRASPAPRPNDSFGGMGGFGPKVAVVPAPIPVPPPTTFSVSPLPSDRAEAAGSKVVLDEGGLQRLLQSTGIESHWLAFAPGQEPGDFRLDLGPTFTGSSLRFTVRDATTGEVLAEAAPSHSSFKWLLGLPTDRPLEVWFHAVDRRGPDGQLHTDSARIFTVDLGKPGAGPLHLYREPKRNAELLGTRMEDIPGASELKRGHALPSPAGLQFLEEHGVDLSRVRIQNHGANFYVSGVLPKGWRFGVSSPASGQAKAGTIQYGDGSTGTYGPGPKLGEPNLVWVCTPERNIPVALVRGFVEPVGEITLKQLQELKGSKPPSGR